MGAKASEQRRQSERGRNGEGEAKEDFFAEGATKRWQKPKRERRRWMK